MATCNVCHAQYTWGDNPCWRCGHDNSFWEAQRELPRLRRFADFFGNIWGLIAIALDGITLLLLGYFVIASAWTSPDIITGLTANKSTLMGLFLAWFMSFIATFVIYAVRFQLWNYNWLRHVLKPPRPDLYTSAVILFLFGVLLLLIHLSLSMFFVPSTSQAAVIYAYGIEGLLIQKILMPAMVGLIFASFTAGSMLMSAGLFIDRLNEKSGQPIFMNTKILSDIVQRSAAESIEVPLRLTRPSAIKRTEQGGISMILNHIKEKLLSDGEREEENSHTVIRRYRVEADMWGQISSLVEDPKLPNA